MIPKFKVTTIEESKDINSLRDLMNLLDHFRPMKCLYMRLRSHKKPLLRLVGMKKKKTENFELGQIEELALISK